MSRIARRIRVAWQGWQGAAPDKSSPISLANLLLSGSHICHLLHVMVATAHNRFRPIGTAHASLCDRAAACSDSHSGRHYQTALVREIIAGLESPLHSAVLGAGRSLASVMTVVPTGAGKTHVALATAAVLQREAGLSVGWCAPRRDLLHQAQQENRKFRFDIDLTLISLFQRNPPQVDLLIMDEAHRDACMTAATLNSIARPTYILGLTATPYRLDRARLCYSHVLKRCSIQSLQDDGFLSPYRHVAIDSWDPTDIAKTWITSRHRFGKTLIFFHTHAQASRCTLLLRRAGVRVELVSGESDRERQIKAFGDGKLDVLVAMACLTEGFNDPTLATVFCRPASRGLTVQMGGRAFRLDPKTPVKTIVQHRDTHLPFTRIAKPIEQFILSQGIWRSIGATRELDSIIARMRLVAAQTTVSLPRLITKHRSRTAPRPFFKGFDPNDID
ncbi:MAG: helicase [Phycisphaerales bacterium]|nr:helicase [Phycisphaerales bacterium]